MLPLWQDWIRRGWVSGELYAGPWANVGTPARSRRARRAAATALRPHHHTTRKADERPIAMNPLLDFSGLPRFDAIRPEDVSPAVDELVARARAAAEAVATDARPADVGHRGRAARRCSRPASIARGARSTTSTPSSARRRLRDAYHASLPKITALLHRSRAGRAPLRPLQGARCLAGVRGRRTPRDGSSSTTSSATSVLGGADLPAGAEGATQGGRGRARRPVGEIRRQRARRDQRLRALRRRREQRARRDSRRRARGGARRRARRRAAPAGS